MKIGHILRPGLGQLGTHPPLPLRYATAAALPPLRAGDATKISIVVPSFNQGVYLERTLRSIIDQNYPNVEILVVDGGSSDSSLEVIKRYEDRLFWWVSEKDGGQADAINKGFRRTTGQIMAWINSDDLVADGALRRIASHFDSNPNTDVVYGNRILVDENDMEIGRWLIPFHSRSVLKWADFVPQETLYWRRSAWDAVGGTLDDAFQFAMDWDFLLRLSNARLTFEHIPEFLGLFRIHGKQKTSAQIGSVGREEINRLRRREIGRDSTRRELLWHVVPFLLASRYLEVRSKFHRH